VQVENCGLSDETVRALHKRGVASLFPIQKHVFDPAMSGRDLIGRAKTGSGKTLAFSLPVIEALLKVRSSIPSHQKATKGPRTPSQRYPSNSQMLRLLGSRELRTRSSTAGSGVSLIEARLLPGGRLERNFPAGLKPIELS
jgi:superfamily II DNA/RNA helicase